MQGEEERLRRTNVKNTEQESERERTLERTVDLTYPLHLRTIKPPAAAVSFNPPPVSDLNS